MKNSELKQIPGFEGYSASIEGKIFSHKSNRFLKSNKRINNSGYETLALRVNGKTITESVHRLLAISFFGSNECHVNHKNGNKRDNRIENLEFVTRSENMKHAYREKLLIPYDRSGSKNPMYGKIRIRDGKGRYV